MTRRREFSPDTKRAAYERSGEICECHRVPALRRPQGCGVRLRSGHFNYEHIQQNALGGDNDLENCAILVRTCWREKTDTVDLPLIAKNNRQRDRNRGIKPKVFRPLPGTVASGIKLPLRPRSFPIDRATGEQWKPMSKSNSVSELPASAPGAGQQPSPSIVPRQQTGREFIPSEVLPAWGAQRVELLDAMKRFPNGITAVNLATILNRPASSVGSQLSKLAAYNVVERRKVEHTKPSRKKAFLYNLKIMVPIEHPDECKVG